MFLKSSSFWSITSAAFRAGGALISLPIALRVLSPAELGLYYTFLGLIAFSMLLDMGFGQTLVRFAAQAWAGVSELKKIGLPDVPKTASPNLGLVSQLLSSARFWYMAVSVIVVLVLAVPGGYYVHGKVDSAGLPAHLVYCWLTMSLAIGFAFNSEVWRTFLFGIGGVVEAHKTTIAAQCGSIVVTVLALLAGLGLWSFVLARVVLALLNNLLAQGFLVRMFNYREYSSRLDGSLISLIWPMAWRQGAVVVGEFLVLRASIIVCATLFGLEQTGSYGLSLQIFGALAAICTAPLAVNVPALSELRVLKKIGSLISLFVRCLYIGLLVFAIGGCVLIWLGPSVLDLLDSQTRLPEHHLMVAIMLAQLMNSHQYGWMLVVLTENKNPLVFPILISGVVVVLSSWYFGSLYGMFGLVMAQLAVPIVVHFVVVARGFIGLQVSVKRFFHQAVRG